MEGEAAMNESSIRSTFQPSPYSGDDNPLSGPLIGPGARIGVPKPSTCEPMTAEDIGRLIQTARTSGVLMPITPIADEPIMASVLVTPSRFQSRFRTRRHA